MLLLINNKINPSKHNQNIILKVSGAQCTCEVAHENDLLPLELHCMPLVMHSGRVLLGLFRNRNSRNRRYMCSFGSCSVFGMNRISFGSFCSRKQNEQNERNTIY